MTSEIQKYNSENKPQETTKDIAACHSKKLVFGILCATFLFGLALFAANGLLEKRIAIVITYLDACVLSIVSFNKFKNRIKKVEYWIGVLIIFVFFTVLSIFLFMNTYHSIESSPIILKSELKKPSSLSDTTKQENKKSGKQPDKYLQPTKTKITNITSINQKGGQIAETINNNITISPPQRKLQTDSVFAELYSNRGFSFALHFETDDKESRVFAENIEECLLKASWKIIGSTPHAMDFSSKNVTIDTGTSPACEKASKALLNVLLKNKIVARIVKNVNLKGDFMYLRIYPME